MAEQLLTNFRGDCSFLDSIFKSSSKELQSKMAQKNVNAETLKALNWEVVESSNRMQQCQMFTRKLSTGNAHPGPVLKSMKTDYEHYLKNFYKEKRSAATHILIIAVSDERRQSKPYTIPVQYIPYKSLRDQYIRDITAPLKKRLSLMLVLKLLVSV